MRKLLILPLAVATASLAAAPAAAQIPETTFKSQSRIAPKKAGTPKKPRGIQLAGKMTFKTVTQGIEEPIVTGGDILIARGAQWNGGKYRRCSGALMRRSQGVQRCPKGSIVGSGSGVAYADRVDAAPDVVFVNGGKSTLWAFTTLYNPAIVQEPIRIKIKKQRGKKWAYKASFRVPKVLQIIGGVPVTLRSFNYKIGGKFKLPGQRKVTNAKRYAPRLLATTSCPKSGKYRAQATAHYLYNTGQKGKSTVKSTVRCRR
jgi:hypothetical protein